jgi:hypothetical protein
LKCRCHENVTCKNDEEIEAIPIILEIMERALSFSYNLYGNVKRKNSKDKIVEGVENRLRAKFKKRARLSQ